MIPRRTLLSLLVGALSAASLPALAQAPFDLGPEQPGRIRAEKDPAAVAAVPKGFKFVEPGSFTVGISPGGPPLTTYATDAKTMIGADPDFALLIADSLGLKLNLVPLAWADWPL